MYYTLFDGAGEAKADLLPGSPFLTELNNRSHPESIDTLIIAGSVVPWYLADTQQWHGLFQHYGRIITQKIGTGLVTATSSQLPGIEQKTVPGTHLSIIRNFTSKSNRTPPAILLLCNG